MSHTKKVITKRLITYITKKHQFTKRKQDTFKQKQSNDKGLLMSALK